MAAWPIVASRNQSHSPAARRRQSVHIRFVAVGVQDADLVAFEYLSDVANRSPVPAACAGNESNRKPPVGRALRYLQVRRTAIMEHTNEAQMPKACHRFGQRKEQVFRAVETLTADELQYGHAEWRRNVEFRIENREESGKRLCEPLRTL
jgi:hypothetical protein